MRLFILWEMSRMERGYGRGRGPAGVKMRLRVPCWWKRIGVCGCNGRRWSGRFLDPFRSNLGTRGFEGHYLDWQDWTLMGRMEIVRKQLINMHPKREGVGAVRNDVADRRRGSCDRPPNGERRARPCCPRADTPLSPPPIDTDCPADAD